MLCLCCRFNLHDGEHLWTFRRAEGLTADTTAEGEWHPLRYLSLLHRWQRQQPPRSPKCIYQRKQQSHGDACLERFRSSNSLLGTDRAGCQHLLAELLSGETSLCITTWSHSLHASFTLELKPLKPVHWVKLDIYYLKRSKQSHNSPDKKPWIINSWA